MPNKAQSDTRAAQTRLIDNVRIALNPVSDWGMLAGGR